MESPNMLLLTITVEFKTETFLSNEIKIGLPGIPGRKSLRELGKGIGKGRAPRTNGLQEAKKTCEGHGQPE